MKHLKKLAGIILAISLLLGTAAAVPVEDITLLQEETTVSEHNGYIVKLRRDGSRMRLQSADDTLEPIAYAADYYVAQTIEEVLPYLEADMVESLDANVRVELLEDEQPPLTNDPRVAQQWYLENIHAPALWNGGLDGDGITIAVIDSGVLDTHEDLAGANIVGRNFCGGVVEGELQYPDMYRDTNANGHGTAVTGVLTARRGNEIGIAGLLDKVKILSLRCFSPDNEQPQNVRGGWVDSIISAVGYAMEQGADVINMSLGVREDAKKLAPLEAKLREASDAGIILVASAGNYGETDPNTPVYPASYDFVVSVAATRSDNIVMSSSQKNAQVTIAAPGNAICTTRNSNTAAYGEMSGTSLAAPIVSALAAVVKQRDKKIDTDGFIRLLQSSAIDRGAPGKDTSYGWGSVDAQNLISALDASYIINYETGGGTLPTEYKSTYRIAQDVGAELPIPTRGSYDTFTGWYLDEALTKGPYTTLPAGCAGNVSLWAGWKQSVLPDVTVKLVGLNGIGDVTAAQDENGVWTALLPDGTTSGFIASLTASNIEITGVEATDVKRIDNTKWNFTVEGTPFVLNLPVPKPLRTTEAWEGTATPASLDELTKAVACRMPVAEWFTGDIGSFAKATADLPKELGSLGITTDKKTMVFTPTAAAAGQTLKVRICARNGMGLSEFTVATIVVGELPPSRPVLTETEALFQKEKDGDISVGMTLYGGAVSGVIFSDESLPDAAYAVEGETLILKIDWLNTLTYGDYALTVNFADGTSAPLTLKVRIPKPTVVLDPAAKEGTATPASLDGTTAVVPFTEEDVSAWFGGEVDGYTCTVSDGAGTAAVEGSKVTYTPAAADAEKNVTLEIRAKNETGESDPVTVTVAVAAAPLSDPKVESTGLTFRTTSSLGIAARVTLNGATLTKITCDDEAIDASHYTVSEQDNTVTFANAWLKTRTAGEYVLRFCFENCRTEELALPLTLTVVAPGDSFPTGGLPDAFAGIAEALVSNPSVEIPEANVTVFYTPNGGKADLTVDDTETARLAQCETISISFPAGDILAAQLSEKLYRAPKSGTILKFPSGSFFIRSTAPVSGFRTFSLSSPSQNMWYVSFTGDPAGVTVLLPCAQNRWKATLRTANGERVLPSVYDTKENCLRVVLPESGTLMIAPDTAVNPFKDVAAGTWYHDAVLNAYGAKLLQGVGADTFAPDTPVSRAMLVTILHRLSGAAETAAASFTDVAAGTWYANAAAWAQKQNLVNGYPDGSFRPDASVSRQELMTIFWRFAAKQGAAKESPIAAIADYADVKTVAEYAVTPICGMVANGIVTGVGTNPARLAPTAGATRAQLAVILQRFVEHLSK